MFRFPTFAQSIFHPHELVHWQPTPILGGFTGHHPLAGFGVPSVHDGLEWQEYTVPGPLPQQTLSKLQDAIANGIDTNSETGGRLAFTFSSRSETNNGETTSSTNFSVGKAGKWTKEDKGRLEGELIKAVGEGLGLKRIENTRSTVDVTKAIEGKAKAPTVEDAKEE